jgi:hypothetical protein
LKDEDAPEQYFFCKSSQRAAMTRMERKALPNIRSLFDSDPFAKRA